MPRVSQVTVGIKTSEVPARCVRDLIGFPGDVLMLGQIIRMLMPRVNEVAVSIKPGKVARSPADNLVCFPFGGGNSGISRCLGGSLSFLSLALCGFGSRLCGLRSSLCGLCVNLSGLCVNLSGLCGNLSGLCGSLCGFRCALGCLC